MTVNAPWRTGQFETKSMYFSKLYMKLLRCILHIYSPEAGVLMELSRAYCASTRINIKIYQTHQVISNIKRIYICCIVHTHIYIVCVLKYIYIRYVYIYVCVCVYITIFTYTNIDEILNILKLMIYYYLVK